MPPDRRARVRIAAARPSWSSGSTRMPASPSTSGSAPRLDGDDRHAERHRFEHRQAEAFVERRQHQHRRLRDRARRRFVAHVAEHCTTRARQLAAPRRSASRRPGCRHAARRAPAAGASGSSPTSARRTPRAARRRSCAARACRRTGSGPPVSGSVAPRPVRRARRADDRCGPARTPGARSTCCRGVVGRHDDAVGPAGVTSAPAPGSRGGFRRPCCSGRSGNTRSWIVTNCARRAAGISSGCIDWATSSGPRAARPAAIRADARPS